MILASLILSSVIYSPRPDEMPTMDEVINHVNKYYADVTNYSDTWNVDYFSDTLTRIKFIRKMDGPRYRSWFSNDGINPAGEVASDGTTEYSVDDRKKQYLNRQVIPGVRQPMALPDVAPDMFTFTVKDHGLILRANPPLVTTAFDTVPYAGQTVRHMVAEGTRNEGKGKIRVELWMDPKEWVVYRLVVRSYNGGVPDRVIHAQADTINFANTFTLSDFQLPESRHAGYEKMSSGTPQLTLGL